MTLGLTVYGAVLAAAVAGQVGQSSDLGGLASLGAAGLMGGMWLWERAQSRKRDQQLDDAHERIMGDAVKIERLIDVVRDNTAAMTQLREAVDHLHP